MELDDLKNDWDAATNKANLQTILSPERISFITQKKYYSRMNKIKYPEIAGAIVCLAGLGFVGFNFNKLDTIFLQAIGGITILLLIVLPVVSLLSLSRFMLPGELNKPCTETIKQFAFQKLRFRKYQKINVLLCYVLLITIIILLPKFFYGKNISTNKYFWIFSFSLGYIFLLFFSKWVNKFYSKSIREAEELLSEIHV